LENGTGVILETPWPSPSGGCRDKSPGKLQVGHGHAIYCRIAVALLMPWKLHLYLAYLLPSGLWVIILALVLPFSRLCQSLFLECLEITFKKSEKGIKMRQRR